MHADDVRTGLTMVGQQATFRTDDLPAPEFVLLPDFDWFLAEYAVIHDDVIVHFFPKANGRSDRIDYWTTTFGRIASAAAIRVFKEGAPRLSLQYFDVGGLVPHALSQVPDAAGYPSWCLIARGFGILFAPGLVSTLCDAIESESSAAAGSNQSST